MNHRCNKQNIWNLELALFSLKYKVSKQNSCQIQFSCIYHSLSIVPSETMAQDFTVLHTPSTRPHVTAVSSFLYKSRDVTSTARGDQGYSLQFFFQIFWLCHYWRYWNDTYAQSFYYHCPLKLHFLFHLHDSNLSCSWRYTK